MKLLDLSQPLTHRGPNCPLHPPIDIQIVNRHESDDAHADHWHMEAIAMVTHTGSHVDAPLHKVPGGASISDLPLETWVGPAYLADLRGSEPDRVIGPDDLAAALAHALTQTTAADRADALRDTIVLVATGFGDRRAADDEDWFHRPPKVSDQAATWLVEHGVRGVGIDHYSVCGLGPTNARTHALLLSHGTWIVEELRFPDAVWSLPQPVKFWALPINIADASGAFCRPVIELEA